MQHTIELEAIATARLLGSTWSATGPQGTETTVSGVNEGETAVNRAFMRFGSFSIPSYANIVSATLRVYVSARSSSSGYTHNIYPVTDNGTLWTPQARNGAAWSTVARNTIYLTRDNMWVSASVMDIAEAWQAGTADPERGLCIFSEAAGSWKRFDGANRANRPKLTIVYDVPASVPVPDKSSVALGGSLTTNLIVNEAGATHIINYNLIDSSGEKWYWDSFNIGSASSHTFTIPVNMGNSFANALTATLEIAVATTVNGESRGSVTAEVALTLPDDAAPTATCTATRTWVEGTASTAQLNAYVQSRSGVTFALAGTANYGATVSSWQLSIDGKAYTASGASASIAHTPITGGGEVPYTYTVTDSRGLSRSYTGTLTVLAWSAPQVTAFSIQRVNSAGTEAVDGTYALASLQGSASSLTVDGVEQNSLRYYVQYRQTGTEAWTDSDEVSASAISASQSWVLQADGEDIGSFNDMQGYQFRLVLEDIYAVSQAMDEMPTKEIRLSIHEASGSMGFGGEAQASTDGPHYDFYGPVHLRAGVTGQFAYTEEETDTGMRWYDGKPIYCRVFAGTFTNGGVAGMVIGSIPDIETLVRVDGCVKRNQGSLYPISFAYPNSQENLTVNVMADRNIQIYKGNVWVAQSYAVALLYTKTDAAASSPSAIAQLPADTASVVQALSNRVGALEQAAVNSIGG